MERITQSKFRIFFKASYQKNTMIKKYLKIDFRLFVPCLSFGNFVSLKEAIV